MTLRYAKKLVQQRGANAKNHDELAGVLGGLLDRAIQNQPANRAERRLAINRSVHDSAIARDMAAGGQLPALPELEDAESSGDLFTIDDFDLDEIEPVGIYDANDDLDKDAADD